MNSLKRIDEFGARFLSRNGRSSFAGNKRGTRREDLARFPDFGHEFFSQVLFAKNIEVTAVQSMHVKVSQDITDIGIESLKKKEAYLTINP